MHLDWFCPCRHWASIIYKDRPCPACGAAKPASLVDAAMMAERLASARMHGQMDAVIGAVNPNDARVSHRLRPQAPVRHHHDCVAPRHTGQPQPDARMEHAPVSNRSVAIPDHGLAPPIDNQTPAVDLHPWSVLPLQSKATPHSSSATPQLRQMQPPPPLLQPQQRVQSPSIAATPCSNPTAAWNRALGGSAIAAELQRRPLIYNSLEQCLQVCLANNRYEGSRGGPAAWRAWAFDIPTYGSAHSGDLRPSLRFCLCCAGHLSLCTHGAHASTCTCIFRCRCAQAVHRRNGRRLHPSLREATRCRAPRLRAHRGSSAMLALL